MRDGEEKWVGRFSGLQIVIGSVALGIAGIAPLLLYVLLGPSDGNPIGLGLLAMVSVPVAGCGMALGLIKIAIEFFAARS